LRTKDGISLALLVGVLVLGGVAVGSGDIPFLSSASDSPDADKEGVELVQTSDYGVDGEIRLPTTIGSGEVYLLTEQPEERSPTHWGDYADFDETEATSGLTEGVDYHKVSLSSADTATFTNLDGGKYHGVLVDKSSPRDYHYEFFTVEMPDQVGKFRVEQDQPVSLIDRSTFIRFPTYDEDYTHVFEPGSSSAVSLSADIDDASSSVTDRERTIRRTVELSGGASYLGEIVVENFNDADGISEVDVTVTSDDEVLLDKTLKDGSTDEFGSTNAYTTALVDQPEENPEDTVDQVEIAVDVVYDASGADTVTGDDGVIDNGEAMFDFGVDDIYGTSIGTEGMVTLNG